MVVPRDVTPAKFRLEPLASWCIRTIDRAFAEALNRPQGVMHELSIACSLVKAAVEQATSHHATRVINVDVILGALSGVEMDSLMFCFPAVARGTMCDGAALHVEIAPALGRCPGCLATCQVRDFMDACPDCGAWPLGLKGGREMTLRAVEVE